MATQTVKGHFSDLPSLVQFCSACDIVTLENEFIDQQILEAIDEQFPQKLFPNSKTFKLIGDKISEKKSFEKAGLKVAFYKEVKRIDDISAFCHTHGFPVVLKSSKGGYDGYGNATIKNEKEIEEHFF